MMSFNKIFLTSVTLTALTVSPVFADQQIEEQGWWGNMMDSIHAWYTGDNSNNSNQQVEDFLDEVTIAVPPMTEEDATMIEPAAGNIIQDSEYLENEITDGQDQQSYNTDFTNTSGSVAAFENPDSYRPVEELAEIVPAAGDAEGINDEAIVPTKVDEKMADAEDAMDAEASEDKTMVEGMMDNATGAANAVSKSVTDLANEAAEGTKNMLESADETIKDGIGSAKDMITSEEAE